MPMHSAFASALHDALPQATDLTLLQATNLTSNLVTHWQVAEAAQAKAS